MCLAHDELTTEMEFIRFFNRNGEFVHFHDAFYITKPTWPHRSSLVVGSWLIAAGIDPNDRWRARMTNYFMESQKIQIKINYFVCNDNQNKTHAVAGMAAQAPASNCLEHAIICLSVPQCKPHRTFYGH